jgi:hypothetical protein
VARARRILIVEDDAKTAASANFTFTLPLASS